MIVGAHLNDSLGNLLPISSNVLDGGAPDVAGNARKTFDSGVSVVDGIEHDIVPIFARPYFEQHAIPFPALVLRVRRADAHHDPVKTHIAHQQIASTTEDEERKIALPGELHRLLDLSLAAHLAEVTGWPAHSKRRIGGKRNKLLKLQRHGLRVQHR
jgi:hypothetical protein